MKKAANEFGFTNNREQYEAAIAYRLAAMADGWKCLPTYGDHEPVERAAKLTREGFTMSIISRSSHDPDHQHPGPVWHYEANVHIWGPDGLAIAPPPAYDWNAIIASVRHCNYCNANDVDTKRVGFAGRCCDKCLPEQKKKLEFPGWNN